MTNIVKIGYKTNFGEYSNYILTQIQLLVVSSSPDRPRIVLPRHLFEQWLADNGRFSYFEEVWDAETQDYAMVHRFGLAEDYWKYNGKSAIMSDLREYLTNL